MHLLPSAHHVTTIPSPLSHLKEAQAGHAQMDSGLSTLIFPHSSSSPTEHRHSFQEHVLQHFCWDGSEARHNSPSCG